MFLEPLEVNNIFVEYLNQTYRLLGNHVGHPRSREMKRTLLNRPNLLFAVFGVGRRRLLEFLVRFHEMINNMIKQRQMLTERRQFLGI